MTAEERTRKLFLEIAVRGNSRPDESQFSAAGFDQILKASRLFMDYPHVEEMLESMLTSGELSAILMGAGTLRKLYRLTAKGELALAELQSASWREADALLSVDCEVSEEALDGWWETADVEIKARAFNASYKPFKAEA